MRPLGLLYSQIQLGRLTYPIVQHRVQGSGAIRRRESDSFQVHIQYARYVSRHALDSCIVREEDGMLSSDEHMALA